MATEKREFTDAVQARIFLWERAVLRGQMVTGSVLGPAKDDPNHVFVVWASDREERLDHPRWRVGRKVPLNVYEGEHPVCQCHSVEDAARIVAASREGK